MIHKLPVYFTNSGKALWKGIKKAVQEVTSILYLHIVIVEFLFSYFYFIFIYLFVCLFVCLFIYLR